ncbi:hypothetical protein [Haloferax prahovense]|nr:hypothetical protein [Haloferax prahovense]
MPEARIVCLELDESDEEVPNDEPGNSSVWVDLAHVQNGSICHGEMTRL